MVFGKYCLLERISVGGMAEVFRAKPLPAHESDKMLALKRILPHLAEDDEFITMFVDEAKLTVQLEHPNIVQTYELGNFQTSYYILMEYIAGADVLTLQKRLRERRRIMSVAQACYIAEQVARGLHYAHNACDEQGRPFNIIHRDVSPQNIRLTYDGRVKLIDFGIAKAAVQRTKTQVGVLKGKFGYMSPEQVHGETVDHRADVFALGTTLWEMLTNRRLFNGDNEFETLQMVKNLDIPRPSEKNEQVPPAVDEIVMRALSEHPDERYQTAEQLAEALGEFVAGLNPPYTQRHLSRWMTETFDEQFAEERRKRELYRKIQQPDDVKWFNREYVEGGEEEQPREVTGESVVEDDSGKQRVDEDEDEQIWDPEFAPEEGEEVDHEQFAADHTMVAAGGFDPAAHEGEDDEVVSLADEDIIELEEGELDEVDPDQSAGDVQTVDGARDTSVDRVPVGESVDEDGGRVAEADEAPTVTVDNSSASGEIAAPDASGTHPAVDIGGKETDRGYLWRTVSAIAAVVTVLGLAVVVGYTGLGSERGSQAAGAEASLVVTVEPNPGGEGTFRIDGERRGREAPITVPNLAAGSHTIEVDYPGFAPEKKTVTLKPGELRRVTVDLRSDP
ncbi:MAG: protein kinase, partial [Bradymonadaceae bacterium]